MGTPFELYVVIIIDGQFPFVSLIGGALTTLLSINTETASDNHTQWVLLARTHLRYASHYPRGSCTFSQHRSAKTKFKVHTVKPIGCGKSGRKGFTMHAFSLSSTARSATVHLNLPC